MSKVVPLLREAAPSDLVKAFDAAFRAALKESDAKGDVAESALRLEKTLVQGIVADATARFIPLRSLCDFAIGFVKFNQVFENIPDSGLILPGNQRPTDPMMDSPDALSLFALRAANKIGLGKRAGENSPLLFPDFDYFSTFIYKKDEKFIGFSQDLFWQCKRLLKKAHELTNEKPRRPGRPRRTDLVDPSQPASARVNRRVKSVSYEIEPDLADALDEAVKLTGMKKAQWVRAAFAQAIRDSGGEVPNAELYDRLIEKLREQKDLGF